MEEAKLTVAQILKRQEKIREEKKKYASAYQKYKDLEYDYDSLQSELQKVCTHKKAELVSTYSDDYEGRTYGRILCPVCNKRWEERIYLGRCEYPKSKNYKEH